MLAAIFLSPPDLAGGNGHVRQYSAVGTKDLPCLRHLYGAQHPTHRLKPVATGTSPLTRLPGYRNAANMRLFEEADPAEYNIADVEQQSGDSKARPERRRQGCDFAAGLEYFRCVRLETAAGFRRDRAEQIRVWRIEMVFVRI